MDFMSTKSEPGFKDRLIDELKEALAEQWQMAHYDQCGPLHGDGHGWRCPKGDKCYWPRPEILNEQRH